MIKKPKKEKKEKKRKRTEVELESSEDPREKHKTILAKFQRSSRLSSKLKEKLQSTKDESKPKEPSPELHGVFSSQFIYF